MTEAQTEAQTETLSSNPRSFEMSLTIAETGTTYTPPAAGTWPAVCSGLLDLGTQVSVYDGESKSARKLLLQFEICDSDNRRDDGTPHVISKRFTSSLHTKAALRGFLESWRGRPFTPEELRGFDLKVLVGQACLLGVVHTTRPDNRTFANIASVVKLPKGMAAPQPELPGRIFDLSAPDWEVFESLPDRLREQIQESPEYAAASNVVAAVPAVLPDDDDIPF